MSGFVTGNAAADQGKSHQKTPWFIGHFMTAGDLKQSSDVEVKWGIHRAGERNSGDFVANKTAKTVSIMVSGHFRLYFRDTEKPEVVHTVELDQVGHYALWDNGVEHDWEAVTDCIVLTVRWPSVPDDQPRTTQAEKTA